MCGETPQQLIHFTPNPESTNLPRLVFIGISGLHEVTFQKCHRVNCVHTYLHILFIYMFRLVSFFFSTRPLALQVIATIWTHASLQPQSQRRKEATDMQLTQKQCRKREGSKNGTHFHEETEYHGVRSKMPNQF